MKCFTSHAQRSAWQTGSTQHIPTITIIFNLQTSSEDFSSQRPYRSQTEVLSASVEYSPLQFMPNENASPQKKMHPFYSKNKQIKSL